MKRASAIPADDSHLLGEVDDDGHHDPHFRRYRYVCRCGKAGSWHESSSLARGDHAVHRSDAEALGALEVLGEALSYRKVVQDLLPADPEMDRLAARSLRRRTEGRKPRKVFP